MHRVNLEIQKDLLRDKEPSNGQIILGALVCVAGLWAVINMAFGLF